MSAMNTRAAIRQLKSNPQLSNEAIASLVGCEASDFQTDPAYVRVESELWDSAFHEGCKNVFSPNGPYALINPNDGRETPNWLGNNKPVWKTLYFPTNLDDLAVYEWQNAVRDFIEGDKEFEKKVTTKLTRHELLKLEYRSDAALMLEIVKAMDTPETMRVQQRLTAFLQTGVILPIQPQQEMKATRKSEKNVQPRKTTSKGGAPKKIIAALIFHHEYYNGSIGKQEPIGANQLASNAKVGAGSVSRFFNKQFAGNQKGVSGHESYKAMALNSKEKLIASLKALNGEYQPYDFVTARTPVEVREGKNNSERSW